MTGIAKALKANMAEFNLQKQQGSESARTAGSTADCQSEFDKFFDGLEGVARKKFEEFILNNKLETSYYGLQRSELTGGYDDPRLEIGWTCWNASKS